MRLVPPLPAGQNTDAAFPQVGHRSVKCQQRGPRQWAGSCCHKRRAVARLRSPGAQATMRRLSRSTASQGPAVCFLAPPNSPIASNSSAGHRFSAPFIGPQARQAGGGCQGFFLAARQSCAARRRLSAQCCAAGCARPAVGPRARAAPFWRRRREQTGPGSGSPCIGSGPDPGDGHCAEAGRCRSGRGNVAGKP